ncbi:HYD1 signature containing ADP-ribosyltransferase family protein [Allokutzneria albata]|uniref:RHS repeat-associated core domain-containing protein n=1 Tax=Allokutzneria albata TaxID=211114 RepID=A0A1G9Y7A9_ALLAB|nr:HYD1 signature containing ADP-ribosyltransferase family protein [Allokutzneria albata]SDN04401.1 RHS repeat-associated core domain-containing protein [Allokutzneria albata]
MFLRAVAISVGISLYASTVVAFATPPGPGDVLAKLPALQKENSVTGRAVAVRPLPRNETAEKALKAPAAVSWPGDGVAEADVPPGKHAKAGALPVAVARGADAPAGQQRVRVETFGQDTAARAGVAGTLLKVSDAGGATGKKVSVQLDYRGFSTALGANYGSRLRLTRYPDCVLTTPEKPECRTSTPLETNNDSAQRKVTAEVAVPTAAGAVLAAAAAPSGQGGDYKATPLTPSGRWSAGGSSGDFSYAYPLRTPPVPGGALKLSLGYSSSVVDGRTSATNNQASPVGDGWDVNVGGYITRQYKSCAEDLGGNQGQRKTGDLCVAPGTDNLTLMLAGVATELVYDSAAKFWRPKQDDGSRIERLAGTANGDVDGEHWKITATDGTQYFFGLNRLPGWAEGKPTTQSTWTVPVFGNHAGETCNKPAYADSWCQRAWQWNLDYVVDTRGNVSTFYYDTETNHYGRDLNPKSGTSYVRAGRLARIEYGLRVEDFFAPAPGRVRFDYAERCLPGGAITCEPGQLNKDTAKSWPDVPFNLLCEANTECTDRLVPVFFSRKRLAKIITDVRDDAPGGTWRDVESWTLRHEFPETGDGLEPPLWLAGITYTGHVNGTASLPESIFSGTSMPNRVDGAEGLAPITRFRLTGLRNESGGYIEVKYSIKDCRRADRMPPNAESNTMRCYPTWWTPDGNPDPVLDWFHKYVVTDITEDARTADSSLVKTSYRYGDEGGAWAFNDNPLIRPEHRTWSEWRGYHRVTTVKGEPGTTQTVTENVYLRGMDGDKQPNGGSRDVWLTNSEGGRIEDHQALQGYGWETLNKSGTKVLKAALNTPKLIGPTATNGDHRTFKTVTETEQTRTLLEDNTWRRTKVFKTFNEHGLVVKVDDSGDVGNPNDDTCTTTTYVPNAAAWMFTYSSRVLSVALPCSAGDGKLTDLISDERTLYDGQAFGVAPKQGLVTETQRFNEGSYQTVSRTTHDIYGRPQEQFDAAGRKTTTEFAPKTGFPVRTVTTTNPLGHVTSKTLEPAWGLPVVETGPNTERTELHYDPLGRLTAAWLPGRKAPQTPNLKFAYDYRTDAPTVVSAQTLTHSGAYTTAFAFYDGLLRERQTQKPTVGLEQRLEGRVLTDTFYDSRGLAAKTNAPYYNAENPSRTLLGVLDNSIPNQTVTEFDALERPTAAIYRKLAVEQWRTTTTYGGDREHTVPPAGGTATTVLKDTQDRVVERRQYKAPTTTGAYDATTYRYTRTGNLESVKDALGNTWSYEYDSLGRKKKDVDPDKGTTTFVYNTLDQIESSTDARGKKLSYSYDELGRKRMMFDGETTGPKLAEWTYDTLKKGQLTGTTRYQDGQAYKQEVTWFDDANRPTVKKITIPATEKALGQSYTFRIGYDENSGLVSSTEMPGAGGLPAEAIYHQYNELGMPTRTYGIQTYANEHTYSPFGETLRLTLGQDANRTWATNEFEDGTRRLKLAMVDRNTTDASKVTDRTYQYDPAGNIKRIADAPAGGPADTQCFGYDHLRRLTRAFTPSDGNCTAEPSVPKLGGTAPYWHEFTYDAVGNRLTETKRSAQGEAHKTYTYPTPKAPQPHSLLSTSGQEEFAYDAAGNTTSRKVAGTTQILRWDTEGRVAKIEEAGDKTTSYIYDADGSRLIKKEPGTTTLYLPGMELLLDNATNKVTGKRYYSHGGKAVAVRGSNGGVSFLLGDHHGTSTTSVDARGLAVARRYFDAFGAPRGAQPSAWPDDKGFVGGTRDASGLTHLGARLYDPAVGRFISVDPIMDLTDPQQMHGYAYANNSPITLSDPTGLLAQMCIDDRCEHTVTGTPDGGHYERFPDGRRQKHAPRRPAPPRVVGKSKGIIVWHTDSDSYVNGTKLPKVDTPDLGLLLENIRKVQADEGISFGFGEPTDGDLYNEQKTLEIVSYACVRLCKGKFELHLHYARADYIGIGLDVLVAAGAFAAGAARPGRSNGQVNVQGAPVSMFHYTNEAGQKGILDSGLLYPSLKSVNPKDARYGDGQYVTDVQPGTRTCAQLSRCFVGTPWNGDRFTHYVEIDVRGLNVVRGRDGVFVIPGGGPLDLAGRIISSGKN